ncbi:hypothetical protein V1511DRAFT_501289 [Dipodascopsis uninucleata]
MAKTSKSDISTPSGGSESNRNNASDLGRTKRKSDICRFVNTPGGCRRGGKCPFKHDAQDRSSSSNPKLSVRDAQIEALSQNYNVTLVDGDFIGISLRPSDPDFPFDLDILSFIMIVPQSYPNDPPSISVSNSDIPRGFSLNIEYGFLDGISRASLGKSTLIEMVETLDLRLEEFLKGERRETIKIVNASSKKTDTKRGKIKVEDGINDTGVLSEWGFQPEAIENLNITQNKKTPQEVFSDSEIEKANLVREQEIRQVRARLGIKDIWSDEDGKTHISIPFLPVNKHLLPICLRTVSNAELLVPELYNLENCGVKFIDIEDEEARTVEENFFLFTKENKTNFTLFSLINYLSQNAVTLAITSDSVRNSSFNNKDKFEIAGETQEYLKPPEWDMIENDSHWYSSGGDGDLCQSNEDENDEAPGDIASTIDRQQLQETDQLADRSDITGDTDYKIPANAVSVNFIDIRLINVAILQCTALSLIVKCARCKSEHEIRDIKPGSEQSRNSTLCLKCNSELNVEFFKSEMIHENYSRIGYIKLAGCTPFDFLPSSFMPTCGECLEQLTSNAGISGLGIAQTLSTNCRSCHKKMSILISQVKFVRVADDSSNLHTIRKPKVKSMLSITAGTPLPLNGTCKHYKRSTRWFRFSCCGRVFPCDKCHNEQSDHADEHANRMICGMCSREQSYVPNNCCYCRHSFFRKTTGFWEGGLGTRDQVKMSNKDPHKYKRRA